MRLLTLALFSGSLLVTPGSIFFSSAEEVQPSPYVGQETREIKALSEADVAALLKGEGWGLAKPAELNGIPGPRHVLDLAEQLQLSAAQRQQVQVIFEEMQLTAKALGEKYVYLEKTLDLAFFEKTADPEILRLLLENLGETLTALRFAHLNAHLKTAEVLDLHQNTNYSVLRGYEADHSEHH